MASAQGQDRSNFQPVSSWGNLDFGICKATEGLSFQDHTFAGNWANLKAEGKMRGAYHFLHNDQDGAAQARYFVDFIRANGGIETGDMLWCDSETLGANVDAVTNAFNAEVHALCGNTVIVGTYTNHNVGQHLTVT